mgnify:CR=1 FL=1
MKCPHDGRELTTANYEADIEVDKCGECNGMWLDYRELDRIQDTNEKDYADEIQKLPNLVGDAYAMALSRSKPAVQCPKCDQAMERREHGFCSQVMIDVCPKCRGTWLDGGEIASLEVFFERTLSETREVRSGFFAKLANLFD